MKLTIIVFTTLLLAFSSGDFISDSLEGHNEYRAPLGLPNLVWSDYLAQRSQVWSNWMAEYNTFMHGNQQGVGENIAYRSTSIYNGPKSMIAEQWGSEIQYYISGCTFPDCSSTGDWDDVSHYTQMIWRDTTEVGCAIAQGYGITFLTCQYLTPGNWDGQKCF